MEGMNAAFYQAFQRGEANIDTAFLALSVVILLIVTFILIKTYKASKRVEKKLAEFSAMSPRTDDSVSSKMHFIELNANEYKINKKVLGPLARILDEYLVVVTDELSNITFANERFLEKSGFRLHEIIGNTPEIVDSGHHDTAYWSEMFSVISSGKAWHGQICNRGKEGAIYWTDTFVFPLSFFNEDEKGYLYFGTDITALKQENRALLKEVNKQQKKIDVVEDLLLHSEKMASLGTISAGIAHEINNPIAFVASNIDKIETYFRQMESYILFAQGLVQGTINPEICEKYIEDNALDIDEDELAFVLKDFPDLVFETNDGINRIRKIVADLKSFAHEQHEGFVLTDLHKSIQSSLNLARSELKYKVDVQTDFQNDLPNIIASDTQLSQVFVNLFVNAAHAIDESGTLEIKTRKLHNKEAVLITITDSGRGVEPETLKRIFDPFFTTKPVGKGTGLGLAISQDIIHRHGGKISVVSKPGVGTTFSIVLPFDPAAEKEKNEAGSDQKETELKSQSEKVADKFTEKAANSSSAHEQLLPLHAGYQ